MTAKSSLTSLQQLVATQAAIDVRSVLEAARDEPADERGGFIDLIERMSDERIAAAFASLAMLVTESPASLQRYKRPVGGVHHDR